MASLIKRVDKVPDQHRLAAWTSEVTLRLATERDAGALARLAQLESRPLSEGPILVAARNGVVEAALCLRSGELIADPFRRTAELRALLRCHAGGALAGRPGTANHKHSLRPALAPA
jgi:hypothetical protein